MNVQVGSHFASLSIAPPKAHGYSCHKATNGDQYQKHHSRLELRARHEGVAVASVMVGSSKATALNLKGRYSARPPSPLTAVMEDSVSRAKIDDEETSRQTLLNDIC